MFSKWCLSLLTSCALAQKVAPPNNFPSVLFEDQPTISLLDVPFSSGYINMGIEGKGKMFYWLFPQENKPVDGPLVLWMTGGPGCAADVAVVSENGPYRIQYNGTLKRNPYSWTMSASVLYVDQPLDTGFSEVGRWINYVVSEDQMGTDMHVFLKEFLQIHKEYMGRDLYIVGESYAGHFIPHVASKLVKEPITGLSFRGIGLGNAWVDPVTQYSSSIAFGRENRLFASPKEEFVHAVAFAACKRLIGIKKMQAVAFVECNLAIFKMLNGRNYYDIRKTCDVHPLCYNMEDLATFFNDPATKAVLGVDREWKTCNPLVYLMMIGDWLQETAHYVSALLDEGIAVTVYHGDQDAVANWIGGLRWTEKLKWSNAQSYINANMNEWIVDGEVIGSIKHEGNLNFIKVHGAGHMVPMDQPKSSLEVLRVIINGIRPMDERASTKGTKERAEDEPSDLKEMLQSADKTAQQMIGGEDLLSQMAEVSFIPGVANVEFEEPKEVNKGPEQLYIAIE